MRDLYRALPAVTKDLSVCGLNRIKDFVNIRSPCFTTVTPRRWRSGLSRALSGRMDVRIPAAKDLSRKNR